jgi:fibro-slime domain-containing protein
MDVRPVWLIEFMKRAESYLHSWVLVCLACGSQSQSRFVDTAAGDGTGGAGGGIIVGTGAGGSGIVPPPRMDAGTEDAAVIVTTLPPGFTQTEIGGYKLGAALDTGVDAGAGGPTNGTNCGNILTAVVRDFKGRNQPGGHLDFEGPLYGNNITANLVGMAIGLDQKPVYASNCEEGHPMPAPTCPFGPETTTQANFDQWYRYTVGVNKPFLVNIWFAPRGNGLFTFQSLYYFPVDNAGWGDPGLTADDHKLHNFSFTTELHTRFAYNGGETFSFQGDDDVWVFINNRLAVDVGGLHPPETVAIALDASAPQLGIVKGSTYNLDLFHAERHTPQSTFKIDTNLAFVNCGSIPPDVGPR